MTGKALALLSYNNFDVSKTVGVNILKSINSVDYEKIEACMEVGRFYLTLDDKYKAHRAEWILGFPGLQTSVSTKNRLNKFGVAFAQSITSDVHTYLSPLYLLRTYKNYDALLALLV